MTALVAFCASLVKIYDLSLVSDAVMEKIAMNGTSPKICEQKAISISH